MIWVFVVVIILLIPLAMQFTEEVQWNEAAAYSLIFLALGGTYEMWLWLRSRGKLYRLAFGFALGGLLLLGWVSGAVGIIGSENNSVNLMYWAVPAAMFIGSLTSRFKSAGMVHTMFVTALVQFLVPLVALISSPKVSWGDAGVIGVFILNAFFVAIFVFSGFLFRQTGKVEIGTVGE